MKKRSLGFVLAIPALIVMGCQEQPMESGAESSSPPSVAQNDASVPTTMEEVYANTGMSSWPVNTNRVPVPVDSTVTSEFSGVAARGAAQIVYAYETKDASGRITVATWRCDISGQYNKQTCTVPAGWVRIGGGAHADYTTGPGALLVTSAPCVQNGWCAESKDHGYANRHTLFTYVIGMKISGISSSILQGYVTTIPFNGAESKMPQATATLPPNYTLLSGGAKLEKKSGDNCLLSISIPGSMDDYVGMLQTIADTRIPSGTRWSVAGKDHIYAGTAVAYSYVVGIKSSFPDPYNSSRPFQIRSEVVAKSKANNGSDQVVFSNPSNMRLISGYAGAANLPSYNNRLMYRIGPSRFQDGTYGVIDSKDHKYPDRSGRTYGGQLEIWKL